MDKERRDEAERVRVCEPDVHLLPCRSPDALTVADRSTQKSVSVLSPRLFQEEGGRWLVTEERTYYITQPRAAAPPSARVQGEAASEAHRVPAWLFAQANAQVDFLLQVSSGCCCSKAFSGASSEDPGGRLITAQGPSWLPAGFT